MKILQKSGLVLSIIGIILFTINIFSSSYEIDKASVIAHFDSNTEINDAGDTISNRFLSALETYTSSNSVPFDNVYTFNSTLPKIIEIHNKNISELMASEGISDTNVEAIFSLANKDGSVEYSEAIIREAVSNNELKVKMLMDNTSWMFSDQKSYIDFNEFTMTFNSKLADLNSSVGASYKLHSDGAALFPLNKAFAVSGAKNNTGLWFFLTFGLVIIGALMYNLANIKLLGAAGIKNDGIYHSSLTNRGWVAWIVLVYLVSIYLFLYFAPQYLANAVLLVDPISEFLSGNPAGQWFLYGFIYCVAMTLMAVRMYVKYRHNRYQIFRTTVVLFFQIAFAFIIPEILVRFNMPYYDFKNAWPLDYDFFFKWNIDSLMASGSMGMFMLFWGTLLTLVIIPVMVYFYGKRWYCSWVCGCGGLAETLGDPYRQNSDKSMKAWKFERWIIHGVLVFAIVMTIITLYTFFTGANSVLWIDTYSIQKTYGLLIGSIFSGVIGTGFYPIFGNRTWCRFGCPLAAYMGLVQRFKSRFRITTNGGQCISCGNCSTYCEQGIDVRAYAQKGQNIVRSSCVGCGVCAAVCPRGVLKLENGPEAKRFGNEGPIVLGNDGFEVIK
jgi:Pyruvate/2-oxoacid:ferredoxin oxidoreductase delta subunit